MPPLHLQRANYKAAVIGAKEAVPNAPTLKAMPPREQLPTHLVSCPLLRYTQVILAASIVSKLCPSARAAIISAVGNGNSST